MSIKNKQEASISMSEHSLLHDKLLICDPDKSRSTCHIFISHQSPAEEQSLGKIFLLAEIASHNKINLEIINSIREELKISYFNTENLNIETAFEKALEAVNQKIADMVGDYDTNWLDRLNAIALVIKDDNMHMSFIGKVHAFLIRNSNISDIIQSTSGDESLIEKINPLKAFSNIISGPLQSDDNLIVATTSLLDYFSQEKLKRIIEEHSPSQAISMLDQLLSENLTNTSFGAILVKIQPELVKEPEVKYTNAATATMPAPVSIPTATTTKSSMDSLIKQQEETGKILAPSISKHVTQSVNNAGQKIISFIRLTLLRQPARRVKFSQQMRKYQPAPQYSPTRHVETTPLSKRVGNFLLKTSSAVIKALQAIFSLVKNQKNIAIKVKTAPTSLTQKTSNIVIRFKKLPRLSKILLGLVIVVAFALTQGLYGLAVSENNEEQTLEYDQTISLISQKILNAEAALSYSNESGAKKLLTEAQDLLSGINTNNDNEGKIGELQNDINTQLEKTKQIYKITARKVVNFSDYDEAINIRGLAYQDNRIYVFDPAKKTILATDLGVGNVKTWPQEGLDKTFQYLIPQSNNSLLFLNAGNKLNEFVIINEQLKALTFELPTQDVNIAGMAIYDSRLYLMDIKNNQILKSIRTGNGYSTPVEWIKDDTNLSNAKSFAVDGFIYILSQDGTVSKLLRGARQNWSLDTIDPALTHADKIWTDADTDNIYIMDSQNGRIIEFTKDGQLLKQFVSESFTNLKDFTVDYLNKSVYVLNDNTTFTFDLNL